MKFIEKIEKTQIIFTALIGLVGSAIWYMFAEDKNEPFIGIFTSFSLLVFTLLSVFYSYKHPPQEKIEPRGVAEITLYSQSQFYDQIIFDVDLPEKTYVIFPFVIGVKNIGNASLTDCQIEVKFPKWLFNHEGLLFDMENRSLDKIKALVKPVNKYTSGFEMRIEDILPGKESSVLLPSIVSPDNHHIIDIESDVITKDNVPVRITSQVRVSYPVSFKLFSSNDQPVEKSVHISMLDRAKHSFESVYSEQNKENLNKLNEKYSVILASDRIFLTHKTNKNLNIEPQIKSVRVPLFTIDSEFITQDHTRLLSKKNDKIQVYECQLIDQLTMRNFFRHEIIAEETYVLYSNVETLHETLRTKLIPNKS